MQMNDELIRIPLQFFGESSEDDFEDDFDDDDYYDDEDEDLDQDGAYDDNGGDEGDQGESEDGAVDEGSEDGKGGAEDSAGEISETDALIAELKAAGYEGDDIASLTADVKKKRESAAVFSAAAERRAMNTEGKGHVKSGKPSKGASGDGIAGFSHRDVEEMRRALGPNCSEERARRALERRIRAQAH